MATVTVSTTRDLVRVIVVGGEFDTLLQCHADLSEWWILSTGTVIRIVGGGEDPWRLS